MRPRIRKRPMAEINVVPYIDVMLVLLVIFMITAPLLTQGVKVDLPKTSSEPLHSEETEPLIINITKEGVFFINYGDNQDQPVDQDDILARVSAYMELKDDKPPVLVGGDTDVPYGQVMLLMTSLQQAGVEGVGMLTEPLEQ